MIDIRFTRHVTIYLRVICLHLATNDIVLGNGWYVLWKKDNLNRENCIPPENRIFCPEGKCWRSMALISLRIEYVWLFAHTGKNLSYGCQQSVTYRCYEWQVCKICKGVLPQWSQLTWRIGIKYEVPISDKFLVRLSSRWPNTIS